MGKGQRSDLDFESTTRPVNLPDPVSAGDAVPKGWAEAAFGHTDATHHVYVSKVGSDADSGLTLTSAKLTISAAITVADTLLTAGADSVRVEVLDGGHYTENITLSSDVTVHAPAATLIGWVTMVDDSSLSLSAHVAAANNDIMVAFSGSGRANYSAETVDGKGVVGALTGTTGFQTSSTGVFYVDVARAHYVSENGYGVTAIGPGGHTHYRAPDLYLDGDNAVGINAASATDSPVNIVGFIDHILDGGNLNTTAIVVDGTNSTVRMTLNEIVADTAYNVTDGDLYLVCNRLVGTRTGTPLFEVSDQQYFDPTEKTKLSNITITQPVDLDAIELRMNELDAAVVLTGTWDASSGVFPGGGTAQAGQSWIVNVGGTQDGVVFAVNDRVIAITDNASTATYAANWHHADYTDLVSSVVGLTGAVSKAALLTALSVSDGATAGATWGSNITGQPAIISQVDAEAGTATDEKMFTAQRVKQAIDALGGGGGGGGDTTDLSARNESGATLLKGKAVYIASYDSGDGEALLELADSSAAGASAVVGLMKANLADVTTSATAVQTQGFLGGLDTTAFADGEGVWASSTTPGDLQNYPGPYARKLGEVVYSHVSAGIILLYGNVNTFQLGGNASQGWETISMLSYAAIGACYVPLPVNYDEHRLTLLDWDCEFDGYNLEGKFSTDLGSSYAEGATDYGWSYGYGSATYKLIAADAGDPQMRLGTLIGGTAGEILTGPLHVLGAADAAKRTRIVGNIQYLDYANSWPMTTNCIGERLTAEAHNALKLYMSLGDVSARILLEGRNYPT